MHTIHDSKWKKKWAADRCKISMCMYFLSSVTFLWHHSHAGCSRESAVRRRTLTFWSVKWRKTKITEKLLTVCGFTGLLWQQLTALHLPPYTHTYKHTQIYNLTFWYIFKVSIISSVDMTCKKHLTPIVMAKGCRFFLKGPQVDMITDVYTRTHTCSVLTWEMSI